MAHLWMQDVDGQWGALALTGASLDLSVAPPRPIAEAAAPAALLLKCGSGAQESWALAAGAGAAVRVNGALLVTGLGVLSDRDEIRVNGSPPLFFSTETLAAVQPFPGSDRPVFCGRCRRQIKQGDPAVRCPACSIWHEQSAQYPCWTYHDKC